MKRRRNQRHKETYTPHLKIKPIHAKYVDESAALGLEYAATSQHISVERVEDRMSSSATMDLHKQNKERCYRTKTNSLLGSD